MALKHGKKHLKSKSTTKVDLRFAISKNYPNNSYKAALSRVFYMKKVIEKNDGYRIFYDHGGTRKNSRKREEYLQILYRFTWHDSDYDVNREPNNGRGPVDYAISKGAKDKTLVEFKLASNSKLKQNLKNQLEVYEQANNTKKSITVILYFNDNEFQTIQRILKNLKLDKNLSIVLIDASKKISASKS